MTASLLAIVHKITGSLLVLGGVVVLPTPIPGMLLIIIGLALLAPYFVPVQRLVRFIRRKSTTANNFMLKIKHRCPPVLKRAIEMTHPDRAADTHPAE